MRLKYYATFRGFNDEVRRAQIIDFYVRFMSATVVKNKSGHANLRLFGQIDLYICNDDSATVHTGYHVIKFDDEERPLFDKAVADVRKAIAEGRGSLSIDTNEARWGTTFFEFVDPQGLSWVYEIRTTR